jgi:hypothetical protein
MLLTERINIKLHLMVLMIESSVIMHGNVTEWVTPLGMMAKEFGITSLHYVNFESGIYSQTDVLSENVSCKSRSAAL